MVNLKTCPQVKINRAVDLADSTGQQHLVVFDNTYSEFDDDGYTVYSEHKWRSRAKCDGFDSSRYSIRAVSLPPGAS